MNTIPQTTAPASALTKIERRNRATIKLLFIAALVLLLQIPLQFVNGLQQERRGTRAKGELAPVSSAVDQRRGAIEPANARGGANFKEPTDGVFEAYRMVERALKHGVLVLALVFAAFFLFETLAGLRLHAVHYGLVGAAMCLFYLALLALGEVVEPGMAYVGAAVASSALVVLYSAAILRSRARAAVIGGLLASVHGVLYVVLRMESYALLAGTATLFVAVGAVMWFTRNIDWHAQDAGAAGVAS